jgi:hypothetical protein
MSTVLIVLIIFATGAYIVRMGLDHDAKTKSGPDNSLTASELRRMIAESVEDATSDITARLDRMERRLEGRNHERMLPPASSEEEERFDDPTYR